MGFMQAKLCKNCKYTGLKLHPKRVLLTSEIYIFHFSNTDLSINPPKNIFELEI